MASSRGPRFLAAGSLAANAGKITGAANGKAHGRRRVPHAGVGPASRRRGSTAAGAAGQRAFLTDAITLVCASANEACRRRPRRLGSSRRQAEGLLALLAETPKPIKTSAPIPLTDKDAR